MLSKATYIDGHQYSFGFFIARGNDTGLLFALLGGSSPCAGLYGTNPLDLTFRIRTSARDLRWCHAVRGTRWRAISSHRS
jgi:hypothetical protein